MDSFASDRKLSELGQLDLHDFLDHQDLFDNDDDQPIPSTRRHLPSANNNYSQEFKVVDQAMDDGGWLDNFLDEQTVSAASGVVDYVDVISLDGGGQPQHGVKSEHSYSLSNGTTDDSFAIKMEPDEIDMETGLFSMISPDLTFMNDPDASTATSGSEEIHETPFMDGSRTRSSVVTYSSTLDCSAVTETEVEDCMIVPIKQEPCSGCNSPSSFAPIDSNLFDISDMLDLPPTPPGSSTCSSDSEGGQSPRRSTPPSPCHSPYHTRTQLSIQHHQPAASQHNLWTNSLSSTQTSLFSSPIPTSGILILSEEEKRTLIAEGYPIPCKLPLTKQEEKNLKKIRRKIKNKISAQESRRKKKEYLEHLEKRVEFVSMENITLRKKLDALESNNRSLASQLQKLQSLASKVTTQMQAATCITVN